MGKILPWPLAFQRIVVLVIFIDFLQCVQPETLPWFVGVKVIASYASGRSSMWQVPEHTGEVNNGDQWNFHCSAGSYSFTEAAAAHIFALLFFFGRRTHTQWGFLECSKEVYYWVYFEHILVPLYCCGEASAKTAPAGCGAGVEWARSSRGNCPKNDADGPEKRWGTLGNKLKFSTGWRVEVLWRTVGIIYKGSLWLKENSWGLWGWLEDPKSAPSNT